MTNTPEANVSESQFTAIKHDIVKELFLKTADQTYVVARWCFLNGLYLDFYWNALHALEKYLKAVLLVNGRSAKSAADGGAYRPTPRRRSRTALLAQAAEFFM